MVKSISKIKFSTIVVSILSILIAGINLLFPNIAYAEEDESSKSGIWMSPVNNVISLDPGASYDGSVTVSNTGTEEVAISVEILPYQVDKETYSSIYTIRNSYTQITRWITVDLEKDTLKPDEKTKVNYNISVPKDAPGGGQYAAISIHSENTNSSKANINTTTTANFIIFAHLSGSTREAGEIVEVKTDGFLLAPPINSSVKLTNTGNVDTSAKITVDIENAITGAKLYTNSDEPKESILMPETEKTVNMQFDNVLRLGIMRLSMKIEYLDDIQIINRTVIICPIWLIIIIVAIIIIIVAKILIKKRENSKKRSNSRGFEKPSEKFNIGG